MTTMDEQLERLVLELAEQLLRRQLRLVTAESCTGGWVAEALTSVQGSSKWFERGFVTYSNISKEEMLGVARGTIETYGAVSEQTVSEMASGALRHSHAELSLAISGIAGPGGGVLDKPVGTVCLAWAGIGLSAKSRTVHFTGSRQEIRRQAVIAALQGMIDVIAERR